MTPFFDNFYNYSGFGPAIQREQPTHETLSYYRDKLPEKLLDYWQEYGFCGWAKGLYWTVNPMDYEDILSEWLRGTPFENNDNYYVIGRSAFGKLLIWGEKHGQSIKINTPYCMIFPTDKSRDLLKRGEERSIELFFSCLTQHDLNLTDEDDEPLFERAVEKLGELSANEMYGFEPALALGGKTDLKYLVKVPVLEHSMFLAELGEKRVMADIVALSNELPHNKT